MSFLRPKINSKNPKEAWRAFKLVLRSDEEIFDLLRRDDVVIKDQIYDWAYQYRLSRQARELKGGKLFGMILNDPAHPYYLKIKKMDDEERAADAAKRERERKDALDRILRGSQFDRKLLEAASLFAREYDMTVEEKQLIGNAVFRHIDGMARLIGRKEKERMMIENIQPFLCPPFILEHLKDLPAGWGHIMIEQTITAADIPDEEKREACLRYRVSDGKNVTDCEIGRHQYVLVGEERDENYEDFNHPFDYKVYRCKICGNEMRERSR